MSIEKGYDWGGFFEDVAGALGDAGGIAGALGAGGPQAMTNFVNKIADKQTLELSQRWEGFQQSQARTHQFIRDAAKERHDLKLLEKEYELKTATANKKAEAGMIVWLNHPGTDNISVAKEVLDGTGANYGSGSKADLVNAALGANISLTHFQAAAQNRREVNVARLKMERTGQSFDSAVPSGPPGFIGPSPLPGKGGAAPVTDASVSAVDAARTWQAKVENETNIVGGFQTEATALQTAVGNASAGKPLKGMSAVASARKLRENLAVLTDKLTAHTVKALKDAEGDTVIHKAGSPLARNWDALNVVITGIQNNLNSATSRIVATEANLTHKANLEDGNIVDNIMFDGTQVSDPDFNAIMASSTVSSDIAANQNVMDATMSLYGTLATEGGENFLTPEQQEIADNIADKLEEHGTNFTVDNIYRELRGWVNLTPVATMLDKDQLFGSAEDANKFLADLQTMPRDQQIINKHAELMSRSMSEKEINIRAQTFPEEMRHIMNNPTVVNEAVSPKEVDWATLLRGAQTLQPSSTLSKDYKINGRVFDSAKFWQELNNPNRNYTRDAFRALMYPEGWISLHDPVDLGGMGYDYEGSPSVESDEEGEDRLDKLFGVMESIAKKVERLDPAEQASAGLFAKDIFKKAVGWAKQRGIPLPSETLLGGPKGLSGVTTQPELRGVVLNKAIYKGDVHIPSIYQESSRVGDSVSALARRGGIPPEPMRERLGGKVMRPIGSAKRPEVDKDIKKAEQDHVGVTDITVSAVEAYPELARITGGVDPLTGVPNNDPEQMLVNAKKILSPAEISVLQNFFKPVSRQSFVMGEWAASGFPSDQPAPGYGSVPFSDRSEAAQRAASSEDRAKKYWDWRTGSFSPRAGDPDYAKLVVQRQMRLLVDFAVFFSNRHRGVNSALDATTAWLEKTDRSEVENRLFGGRITPGRGANRLAGVSQDISMGVPVEDVEAFSLHTPPLESPDHPVTDSIAGARMSDAAKLTEEIEYLSAEKQRVLRFNKLKGATANELQNTTTKYDTVIAEKRGLITVLNNPSVFNKPLDFALTVLMGGGGKTLFDPAEDPGDAEKRLFGDTLAKRLQELLPSFMGLTEPLGGMMPKEAENTMNEILTQDGDYRKVAKLLSIIQTTWLAKHVKRGEVNKDIMGKVLDHVFTRILDDISIMAVDPAIASATREDLLPTVNDSIGKGSWDTPHMGIEEGKTTLPEAEGQAVESRSLRRAMGLRLSLLRQRLLLRGDIGVLGGHKE